MKTIAAFCLMPLLFTFTIFSQTAEKIDEIPYLACDDLINRMANWRTELKNEPQNKLYIIYYEGQKRFETGYDKKTKKITTRLQNPKFGEALNRAKEIPLYLKRIFKVSNHRVVLIDGGFRETFSLEIWNVSEGAAIPQPSPTLTRQAIKFSKGKPSQIRTGCGIY